MGIEITKYKDECKEKAILSVIIYKSNSHEKKRNNKGRRDNQP